MGTQIVRGFLFALAVGLFACGTSQGTQDASPTPRPAAAVPERALIRAAQGGRIRSADGLFELVVRPGAIARDTELSVRRLEGAAIPASVAAANPVSGVYAVEPDGLRFGGDGAYAIYRFLRVPDGLVTGVGAEREFAPLVAVTQPAAGGAIALQPGSSTVYRAGGSSVRLFARLAHLSTQFVVHEQWGVQMNLRVDFGEREHRLGVPFTAQARVALLRVPPRTHVYSALAFSVVPRSQEIISRNTGQTSGSVLNDLEKASSDFVAGNSVAWPARLTDSVWEVWEASPPADFVCRVETRGVEVTVGMNVGFRFDENTDSESHSYIEVSATNLYTCVDRPPPPRDAGRDAAGDRIEDLGLDTSTDATPDADTDASIDVRDTGVDAARDATVTGLDAGRDAGSDTAPDVARDAAEPCTTTFTRCGRDCADLSSDIDHCGMCGNVCPLLPGVRRVCRDCRCVRECPAGLGDCDGNIANGCEARLDTRLNCGACGAMPPEVCDGADNDCDGAVDEGCPTQITWPVDLTYRGALVGRSVAGDSRASVGAAYFNPIIGLCGTRNPDGSLRQLRGVLGFTHFRTDRTVRPFRYFIEVEEVRVGGVRCEDGTSGVAGGTPWSLRCEPNMIADTISGIADANIGQVQLRCARWDVVRVADGVWRTTRGAMATTSVGGMGTGMPFDREVPDNVTTMNPGALLRIDYTYPFTTNSVIRTLQPSGVSPRIQ